MFNFHHFANAFEPWSFKELISEWLKIKFSKNEPFMDILISPLHFPLNFSYHRESFPLLWHPRSSQVIIIFDFLSFENKDTQEFRMSRHRAENAHSTQISRRRFGRARATFYYSKGIFLNYKTFSNFSLSPPSPTKSVSLAFNVSCCTKTVFFFLSFSCRSPLFRLHSFLPLNVLYDSVVIVIKMSMGGDCKWYSRELHSQPSSSPSES